MHVHWRLLAIPLLLLAACGDPGKDRRIAKQELMSLDGVVSQTWVYRYDAAGLVTQVEAYSATGALTNTAVYAYANGLRTSTTTTDASGALIGTQLFTWDAGVLARLDSYSAAGDLTNYSTYTFAGGQKQVTSRFLADGTSQGHNDFSYDALGGRRTGATSVDAGGTVTMVSTRAYQGPLMTQVQVDYPSGQPSVLRRFTYEAGHVALDLDVFFEF